MIRLHRDGVEGEKGGGVGTFALQHGDTGRDDVESDVVRPRISVGPQSRCE